MRPPLGARTLHIQGFELGQEDFMRIAKNMKDFTHILRIFYQPLDAQFSRYTVFFRIQKPCNLRH